MTPHAAPSPQAAAGADDPRAELLRLINGFQVSQALHVAATLRLADHLGDGAASAGELAAALGAQAPRLHRLMRALAAVGVLRAEADGRFALTAAGHYLRESTDGTLAPMAVMIGQPSHWQAWGALAHAVRHDATAFDHVHGADVWTHRRRHAGEARIFDRAMAAGTDRFADAVLAVCDFRRFRHVVDVGGGDGTFLARILAAHPALRGTLFDCPDVSARAAVRLDGLGLGERCAAVGGDFFASVPAGGDAYLLKWILHDWDDARSVAILRACRRAMAPDARLLIFEHVLGAGKTTPDGALMDLNMMVMTGGRERRPDEFAALLAAGGFELASVQATAAPLGVIEARPAPSP